MKGNKGISKENKGKMKITRLVVAGGAMAVAGLFATFVLNIRRKIRNNSNGKRAQLSKNIRPKQIEEDNGTQGLLCLLRIPPKTSRYRYMRRGDSLTMSIVIEEDQAGFSTETDDGFETQNAIISGYSEKEITEFNNDVEGNGSEDVIANEEGKEMEQVEENENGKATRFSSMDLHANLVRADEQKHINNHVRGKCMKMNYEDSEGASKIRVCILLLFMFMIAIWLQKQT